ncbi:hypothetical protein C0Q57_30755 [Streptomyces albidoflavus]|uniref:hypothetical protein n=1 Tax=Streptomyces albidoflavus TaxID=1886 RepID=UPI00101EE976|nr:hypothetical protein [Streptomyces albidoflavus]RZD56320.1 hypothetical protein C0Q57_30755 [Streptomyces albidoflavus]
MANMHRYPVRGLRGIDDALWEDFRAATERAQGDRSSTLREFMEWFVRRDGAELPTPPPAE